MDSRYLRKNLMFTAGIIELVVAIFLLFYLDITAKINVTWLFAIAATGLAGGILTVFGANSIEDEESVISKFLALLGSVLSFVLIVVLFGIKTDATLLETMLYNGSIEIVVWIAIAIAIGNAIFSLVPVLWNEEE